MGFAMEHLRFDQHVLSLSLRSYDHGISPNGGRLCEKLRKLSRAFKRRKKNIKLWLFVVIKPKSSLLYCSLEFENSKGF